MSIAARRQPLPKLDHLVREIEAAMASGDRTYQSAVVVRSADALTRRWSRLPVEDKAGFDRLLAGLLGQVDEGARITFAERLTPLRRAPRRTTSVLARDASIRVAGPLLEACPSFDEAWLLEIVAACGDAHRCAVARRAGLGASLSDTLISFGDPDVAATLLSNPEAPIPSRSMPTLMRMAARSEAVALALGARADLSDTDRMGLVELAREWAHASLVRDDAFDVAAARTLLADVAHAVAAPVPPERAARFAGTAMIVDAVFGPEPIASARIELWIEGRRIEDVLTVLARDAGLRWPDMIACYDTPDPQALAVMLRGIDHPWPVLKALLVARHAGSPSPEVLSAAYRLHADLSVASARLLARYATARLCRSAFTAPLTHRSKTGAPVARSEPAGPTALDSPTDRRPTR